MRLWMTRRDITPAFPVMLAGYAARKSLSEGVHDPLYMTAVYIEADIPLLILTFDLLYGDESFADAVRDAVKAYVPAENVLLNYSHTHSSVSMTGPDTRLRTIRAPFTHVNGTPLTSDFTPDVEHCTHICGLALDAVRECTERAVCGYIEYARGMSRFGVSRRRPNSRGRVDFAPYDEDTARDLDLDVFRFHRADGSPIGMVWSYACHATVMGHTNLLASADWVGAVRRAYEKKHGGITAFLQGCAGDINPRPAANFDAVNLGALGDGFTGCDFPTLERAGADFLRDFDTAVPSRRLTDTLRIRTRTITLGALEHPAEWWQAIADDPDEPAYRRAGARITLARYADGTIRTALPYRMAALNLGGVKIVFMPCEVVTDIGKRIKARVLGTVTCAYTSSVCCYIPTREAAEAGGYEAQSFFAANITGPLLPDTAERITDCAADLLTSL
ncbi:MAG: neutral/alkaline non-lysosomal ceramidase N-terminal domain-containing protein [Eubacteriales bacterium]|jgi:neutral ceramidase